MARTADNRLALDAPEHAGTLKGAAGRKLCAEPHSALGLRLELRLDLDLELDLELELDLDLELDLGLELGLALGLDLDLDLGLGLELGLALGPPLDLELELKLGRPHERARAPARWAPHRFEPVYDGMRSIVGPPAHGPRRGTGGGGRVTLDPTGGSG